MRLRFAAVALFGMPACFEPEHEEPEEEEGDGAGGCDEVTSDVPLDEVTSLGISGKDLLYVSEGKEITALFWQDGAESELTLVIAADGDVATFVDSEVAPSSGDTLMTPLCEDSLRVPVTVELSTGDGALAESFEATLVSYGGDPSLSHPVEIDALEGDFLLDPDWIDGMDYAGARFEIDFRSWGSQGAFVVEGEEVSGDAVTHAAFDIATWGYEDE